MTGRGIALPSSGPFRAAKTWMSSAAVADGATSFGTTMRASFERAVWIFTIEGRRSSTFRRSFFNTDLVTGEIAIRTTGSAGAIAISGKRLVTILGQTILGQRSRGGWSRSGCRDRRLQEWCRPRSRGPLRRPPLHRAEAGLPVRHLAVLRRMAGRMSGRRQADRRRCPHQPDHFRRVENCRATASRGKITARPVESRRGRALRASVSDIAVIWATSCKSKLIGSWETNEIGPGTASNRCCEVASGNRNFVR